MVALSSSISFGANLQILHKENSTAREFPDLVESLRTSIVSQVPIYPGSEKKVLKLMIKETFGMYPGNLLTWRSELSNIFNNPEVLLDSETNRPEIRLAVKEAVIELVMDLIVGKDADERAKYGISNAMSRVDLLDRAEILSESAQEILDTSAKYVIATGGIEMAKLMGFSDYMMIDMSSTNGQTSGVGTMKLDSQERIKLQLSTDPQMKVLLVDDVIDTGATLVAAVIQVLTTKIELGVEGIENLLLGAQELSSLITELNLLMNSTPRKMFVQTDGRYPDPELISTLVQKRQHIQKTMFHFLHALKVEPVSIHVMTAADKMLGQNMDFYGGDTHSPIYTLAPEFANGNDGEVLNMWELDWLMGVGLDTELLVHVKENGKWEDLKVSLGRKWGDIVKLDDNVDGILNTLKEVPGYRRLQEMVKVAMEFVGVEEHRGFAFSREF